MLAIAALLFLCMTHPAHASEAATGLEWENPFIAFYKSITGPVAFGIAFLGIVVCGAVLIWGGEINEFVRRMVMVILVVAVIMFAGALLRRMFAGGAATITPRRLNNPRRQPMARVLCREHWRGAIAAHGAAPCAASTEPVDGWRTRTGDVFAAH
jgi:type IV secretion system protein VirB2